MDTDRFPSITNFKNSKPIYINKPEKKAIMINKQKIISIVKPDTDKFTNFTKVSKNMDPLIFELPTDKFIDKITSDDDNKKIIHNTDNSNNSNNSSSYSINGNSSNLTVIDDYY
jgi:hypothetical protein